MYFGVPVKMRRVRRTRTGSWGKRSGSPNVHERSDVDVWGVKSGAFGAACEFRFRK